METIEKYFHVVLFVFDNENEVQDFFLSFKLGTLGSERVKLV